MITAWRIIKKKQLKKAFTGEGSAIYGGRWNSIGIPVIYTAETISLAVLEIVVHMQGKELLMSHFVKIPVQFDDDLVFTLPDHKLPKNWNQLPPISSTQKISDRWAKEGKHVVLSVPSAVTPEERNFILNPNHTHFGKIVIGKPQDIKIDERILTQS